MIPVLFIPNRKGFTLIEVIISLVVFAILAGVYVTYFSSSWLTRSADPVLVVRKAYSLKQTMENITEAYLKNPDDPNRLTKLSTDVGAAGSSQDNDFGEYIVVYNGQKHINPDDGTISAQVSPDDPLLISIKDAHGVTLTALFTLK